MAVTRITAFVTVAIVSGLLTLGSGALLLGPALRTGPLRVPAGPLGGVMALIVLCYLAWSAISRNPPPMTAAAQIGLSTFDFYLTATVLFVLLPPSSPFAYVPFITACALAHAIGMLSLVPGGAGVFEAAVFTLLAADASGGSRGALAAALIVYRLVYYVLPLGVATVMALATRTARPKAAAAISTAPRPPSTDERPATDADVEWLIDNASAYERTLRAVGSARHSIWITQLAFDADCEAYGPGSEARSLAGALLAAAARGPIDIRIILNETFLLDTARPLRRFFAERLAAGPQVPGTIEVRGVSSFPRLQHTKIVIVDGTDALLLGSPFVNGYWDDERHQPRDDRRPLRELGGRPLHDLSIALTGAPVADLERLFMELWAPAAALAPVSAAPTGVRIVSTSPRGVLPHRPAGATEILEGLLEGIAAARSLIYIEHQYLSARPIVTALVDALRREERLEVIAVLNENADVTAYRRWQNARLEASGLTRHPRVGLFALWSAARSANRTLLNQVFVHSKVVIVDDAWATAGSANLDGVSLHSYGDDFTGIGRRIFRHTRNFDVNVIVDGRFARGLRSRLWAEHLGTSCCSLVERPEGGWLPLWRAQAQANVAALSDIRSGSSGPVMHGMVLPYSREPTPARQLADLGVRVDPSHLDLCFNPGWMEVHLSPNWVRNMFA
jgi:phosphatidylserine/phosphatidylglycerophosphate/cardiolipin synthase-like enzyme